VVALIVSKLYESHQRRTMLQNFFFQQFI
jgi:hypothetical protein